MTMPAARFILAAALFALGACTPDSGTPDMTRGSADSPMTMLVDQLNNGVPAASGTQAMIATPAQRPGLSSIPTDRRNFGGVAQPILPQGGEKR